MSLTIQERLRIAQRPQVKTRVKPEERLTIECADRVRHQMIERGDVPPWCHVPNEGDRRVAYKVKLIAMGLQPGFPDLIFPAPGSLAIELKMPRGPQSDNQKLVQRWCDAHGVEYRLCTNVDDFHSQYARWHSETVGL